MKECSNCKQVKLKEEFYKYSLNKDGLKGECKKCIKEKVTLYGRTREGLANRLYGQQVSSSKRRLLPRGIGNGKPTYNKAEFREWLFSRENFEELYQNWVDNNYNSEYRPSGDRIDEGLPYTLSNLKLVTWKENVGSAIAISLIDTENNKKINFISLSQCIRELNIKKSELEYARQRTGFLIRGRYRIIKS